MTVLQAQLDGNAADTRRRRVQYRCRGWPKTNGCAFFFLFVFAIMGINCKHLCRRNARLHHFTLDSQAHFSHKHCYLFSKNCGVRLAECFYRPLLPVLWLFLKHDEKKNVLKAHLCFFFLNSITKSVWVAHLQGALVLFSCLCSFYLQDDFKFVCFLYEIGKLIGTFCFLCGRASHDTGFGGTTVMIVCGSRKCMKHRIFQLMLF